MGRSSTENEGLGTSFERAGRGERPARFSSKIRPTVRLVMYTCWWALFLA